MPTIASNSKCKFARRTSLKPLTGARRTALLKALADPRRFKLLEKIAQATSPLSCAQARAALPIAAATLSHHIKELEAAGIVEVRHEGKYHFLSLRPGALKPLIEALVMLEQKSATIR